MQIQIEVMLTDYILGNVVNSDALIKGGIITLFSFFNLKSGEGRVEVGGRGNGLK